jgi:HSP20 family protein
MALPEKWHPATELDSFRHEVDDLLEHFGLGHGWPKAWEVGLRPALEFFVDDNKLMIRVDLPGIEPENVDVKVAGGFLTIRGAREEKQDTRNAQFYRREMRYGSFERTIQLPEGVKAEALKATYKNGVLELTATIPKEVAAKQVKVELEKPAGAKPAGDRKR